MSSISVYFYIYQTWIFIFGGGGVTIPENILAIAAIKKLRITPGPAMVFATIPATKYMPVPQHEPTPNDVRSNVVRHFCNYRNNRKYLCILLRLAVIQPGEFVYILAPAEGGNNYIICRWNGISVQLTVNFGFVLRGSSPWTVRKSFVRISLENRVIPVPPPGIGNENFMLLSLKQDKNTKLLFNNYIWN